MGLVGYARVSTREERQVLDRQVDALRAAGCERIYDDCGSGVSADRPGLSACLDDLRRDDVLVVCAGWKGRFCLEDTVFGGALAARLASDFDVRSSDAALAALHLWQQAEPDLPAYLLQSAHVRRLNSLEASQDFTFCLQIDQYANVLPVWQEDRLIND